MFVKEEQVVQRAEDLGFKPIKNTTICAKITPYGEKTAIDRGVEMFKNSMQFGTPEDFYRMMLCCENELLLIPISWWTLKMKKDEYLAIPYADITHFTAPEAKAITWRSRLTTKDADYELTLSDEKLSSLKLAGGALLEGEWQKTNLPLFVEKLLSVVAG